METSEGKKKTTSCSVIVSNLPMDSTSSTITQFLNRTGPVRKCFLVRDKEYNFTGTAFVTFYESYGAQNCLKLHNTTFNGQRIVVKQSKQKNKETNKARMPVVHTLADELSGSRNYNEEVNSSTSRKFNRSARSEKAGRIVIRNLSFQCNEEKLEKYFKPYGNILEVNMLKNDKGRVKGVAFIQYDSPEAAQKAISECNMNTFMGRNIAVDMSVDKKRYQQLQEIVKREIKEEPEDAHETKIDVTQSPVKEEIKEEEESDEESEDDKDTERNSKFKSKQMPVEHKSKSKDVTEERTLFVRSISFNSSEGSVESIFSKFGDVKYVAFCRDSLTKQFRGSAFVQFVESEAAKQCMEAYEDPAHRHEFALDGRGLFLFPACGRDDAKKNHEINVEKKERIKDKRNLYLAKEGLVRPGTEASEGVSKADLESRRHREMLNKKMMKNLHIFISPLRLCVHNLPNHIDNKKLKGIFRKYSPKGSSIAECKVMYDLLNMDSEGSHTSKGFAFVSFTKHEDALAALRKINNNPEIFSETKRPIIEFSLENQGALRARHKRLQRSQENNPTSSKYIKPDVSNEMPRAFDGEAKPTYQGSKSKASAKAITRNQINNKTRNNFRGQKNSIAKKKGGKSGLNIGGKKRQKNSTAGGPAKKKQKR